MLSLVLAAQLLTSNPTQLTIDVKPEGVEVKVDGKKSGHGGKPVTLTVKPGKHVVRLSYKGDSHEEEVSVKAGEKKTYSWEFEGTKSGAPPTDEAPTPTTE
jgi:hypothetical protein